MKNVMLKSLLIGSMFGLAACSSGGTSVSSLGPTGTYSIVPGVTDLDGSPQAVNKASYYTVVSSSSSENKVTIGGSGLGSYKNPAGQNFVVESKKRLQFSGPANAVLNLGGLYNLPVGASVDVDFIWNATNKIRLHFEQVSGQVEVSVTETHSGVDTVVPGALGSMSVGSQLDLQVAKENGNQIVLYNTTTGLSQTVAYNATMLGSDAYMKITVSNGGSSMSSFSLDTVSTTFPSVNR